MNLPLLQSVLMPSADDNRRDALYEIMKRLQSGDDPNLNGTSTAWGLLVGEHAAAYEEICRALSIPLRSP